MNIIKERRSTRMFKPEAVEKEKIEKLIEAGRWAASGGNTQPWEFVVITHEKLISTLKMTMTGVMGMIDNVPALICICVNRERRTHSAHIDIGCALQNILLCAYSLGLGSCTISGFDAPCVTQLLELPDHLDPALFVILGYSEKKPSPPPRMTLNQLIFRRFE